MNLLTFLENVGAALLMGVAIGLERQIRQHPAGLRTTALVCVGAALFVSLPALAEEKPDPIRMASYVVTGIGFLGGGVILREGFNVRGLNTAATLWCTAAVGTLAGAGFLLQAVLGTAAVLVVHVALRPLVRRIEARTVVAHEVEALYRVRVVCGDAQEAVIRLVFMRHVNSQPGMALQGLSTQDTEQPGKTAVVAEVFSAERNDKYMNELVSRMGIEPGVSAVSWERVS
jgi:putative Mg2+ transporter-C (MgtC) family protein